MFKKKASLPARPPIPNKDEILEDLSRATSDDVVFNHIDENLALITGEAVTSNSPSERNENSDSLEQKEPKDQFHNYKQITSYVGKVENLIKSEEEIKNNRDGLQNLTKDLIQDMTKIKEELKKQIGTPEAIFKNIR
ncbi:hypothetical protein JTE90_001647 [Oedothorax gibbosus]|uniref:Uncharacterized protein n=1 Tax=Oedothorax gibbosus TaxID=931172 RepID=A0AAV6VML5_9ARAC|nr:hypothetical protein JTE90_001647 [Oedothorax gibbosus]